MKWLLHFLFARNYELIGLDTVSNVIIWRLFQHLCMMLDINPTLKYLQRLLPALWLTFWYRTNEVRNGLCCTFEKFHDEYPIKISKEYSAQGNLIFFLLSNNAWIPCFTPLLFNIAFSTAKYICTPALIRHEMKRTQHTKSCILD